MPVTAFGFPFGISLALRADTLPGVSVTTARISSLRKVKGILEEIQLDGAINPGNSGGALINEEGQVIGVVTAGVPGSGLNFATPVSHVLRTA